MAFKRGDHICALYSTTAELACEVASFLEEGLRGREHTDGFTGFRAAADMSWALECKDGAHQVIVYEALLKSLFASCRAIGLCLYDRTRMPLPVLNGALHTHPVAGSGGHYSPNPFYDPQVTGVAAANDDDVRGRVAKLEARARPPESLSS